MHLAMDTATSDIRAVEIIPSSDGDSPVLPERLDQIPKGEEIGSVTADGADDTRRCHTAIIDRKASAIIPIRKNGRKWKEDCPAAIARNDTLRATRHYGRAFWGRAFWKCWTGYHVRSRIEAKMPSPVRSNRWHSPARPQSLRGTHRRQRPRPPDRRNPYPYRPDEPLQRARHRRDRPRRLTSMRKGAVTPQAAFLQQRRVVLEVLQTTLASLTVRRILATGPRPLPA